MNTTKPMSPQDYARACLRRIANYPDSYDQGTWQTVAADAIDRGSFKDGQTEVSCQTTGCVAGTVSILAGDTGLLYEDESVHNRNGRRIYAINSVLTKLGNVVDIRSRGAMLLDLTEEDASWLFDGYRQIPEVVHALIELADGKKISQRHISSMDSTEIERLKNYRVAPKVIRKRVAQKATAAKQAVKATTEAHQ